METLPKLLEVESVTSDNLSWRILTLIYRLCDLGQVILSLQTSVSASIKMRTVISLLCGCLSINWDKAHSTGPWKELSPCNLLLSFNWTIQTLTRSVFFGCRQRTIYIRISFGVFSKYRCLAPTQTHWTMRPHTVAQASILRSAPQVCAAGRHSRGPVLPQVFTCPCRGPEGLCVSRAG